MKPARAHNFGTFFVSFDTWGRRSLFQVDANCELFLRTLYRYRAEQKYLLHEFVVMPDHVHLIVTPLVTLERAVQLIKGGYSYALHQSGRNVEVWQPGFTDHRIRDAQDYQQHRVYVHMNPVRRGLCAAPGDYRYSSVRAGCELDSAPQRLKPLSAAAGRHG